jgi:hypothetical protein
MIYPVNGKRADVARERKFNQTSMGLPESAHAAKEQDMRRKRSNGMGFSNGTCRIVFR